MWLYKIVIVIYFLFVNVFFFTECSHNLLLYCICLIHAIKARMNKMSCSINYDHAAAEMFEQRLYLNYCKVQDENYAILDDWDVEEVKVAKVFNTLLKSLSLHALSFLSVVSQTHRTYGP